MTGVQTCALPIFLPPKPLAGIEPAPSACAAALPLSYGGESPDSVRARGQGRLVTPQSIQMSRPKIQSSMEPPLPVSPPVRAGVEEGIESREPPGAGLDFGFFGCRRRPFQALQDGGAFVARDVCGRTSGEQPFFDLDQSPRIFRASCSVNQRLAERVRRLHCAFSKGYTMRGAFLPRVTVKHLSNFSARWDMA